MLSPKEFENLSAFEVCRNAFTKVAETIIGEYNRVSKLEGRLNELESKLKDLESSFERITRKKAV